MTPFLLLLMLAQEPQPQRVPIPRDSMRDAKILAQQRRDLDTAANVLRDFNEMLNERQAALHARICAEVKAPKDHNCQVALDAGVVVLIPPAKKPETPPVAIPAAPPKPEAK